MANTNTNILKYFPKAFLDDVMKGRCLPFIGSGFSKNAESTDGSRALDWAELGKYFRDEIIPEDQQDKYSQNQNADPIEYISAYEYRYKRPKFVEELREALCISKLKVGDTHRYFCKIPFDKICTTNFDKLLESSFLEVGKTPLVKIEESQLAMQAQNDEVEILKIHGDIEFPLSIIATEDDYDSYISSHPLMTTYIANLLITRTPLFIGYSLQDYDFRQIYHMVKDKLGTMTRHAYTICYNCSEEERLKFERRGISVINLLDKQNRGYKKTLTLALKQLYEYCQKEAYKSLLNKELSDQLKQKNKNKNLICPFIFDLNQYEYYKTFIFPVLRNLGFMPISEYDTVSENRSYYSSIYMMFEQASIICIDIDNEPKETMPFIYEKYGKKVFVLLSTKEIPADEKDERYRYFVKPQIENDDIENSLISISTFFSDILAVITGENENIVDKLIKLGLYKESILNSFANFEQKLRERESEMGPVSFQELINKCGLYCQLNKDEIRLLFKYRRLRNHIAHGVPVICEKKQAEEISKFLFSLLERIQDPNNFDSNKGD